MNFRIKLLLAMLLVVAAITGATVFVTQHRMRLTYDGIIGDMFESQMRIFQEKQKARLDTLRSEVARVAGSVRVFAAIEEGDAEIIYQTAEDELRTLSRPPAFFRFLNAGGEIIPPPDRADNGGHLDARLEAAAHLIREEGRNPSQVGYLAGEKEALLYEVVMMPVRRRSRDDMAGFLAAGFPMEIQPALQASPVQSAIWVQNKLYGHAELSGMENVVGDMLSHHPEEAPERFELKVKGHPFRADYNRINPDPGFPPAYQLTLYSLEKMQAQERNLIACLSALAVAALAGALLLSFLLAHNLSIPIRELSRATDEVREGNYNVRVRPRSGDELGRLAESFNQMTEGIALKEKYRTTLGMVADKSVAEELMQGRAALGGEIRQVSVLFCDIRKFTEKTQGLDPSELVTRVNDHMTALTRVVHERKGVVDKFVGDQIMALFGVPKAYGGEAEQAVRCAWNMIRERRQLNETSAFQWEIGTGIASGTSVAGCMGSHDRMNYTVLGERVNLAARLCAQAAPGQILIDASTREQLGAGFDVAALEPMALKGFRDPVPVFEVRGIPEEER